MVSERLAQDAEASLGRARSATESGEYQKAAELLADSANADTDGRLTQDRAEVFRTLASAIVRSEGQSPEEYAVQLVRSAYHAAIETAIRDAREGVEALCDAARDIRKLAPLMGEEPAAVFDAAIGYQTAAALRELGRRDEAVAAYDGVVERHSGSGDASVQYWLGMCLVNCAQLLLQPEDMDHLSVRRHAFSLVDQMFDELGASENPDIRVRLVRAAALVVSSLVAIGRVDQAFEAFQRFEPHLASDDAETRGEFERWRCVVGQTDDVPLSEDLLRACGLGEEAWQALESLGRGADPEDVASAMPELLTNRVAALLEEAGTELPECQAVILRRNREKLQPIAARGPKPSLNGPIEGLALGVGVRFSLETACEIARRPHFVRMLAQPYVDMLCALCESQLDHGDWRRAWQLAMVLWATAQRLPVDEPRDFMMIRIGVTLMRVAETAWASVPDRRTYDTAFEVSEELFALAAQYDDAVFAATVHGSLGRMLLSPYVRAGTGNAQYFPAVRRWMDRLGEEVTNRALDPEPDRWEIPPFTDDLERAETHVRARCRRCRRSTRSARGSSCRTRTRFGSGGSIIPTSTPRSRRPRRC